jgi:hypothetical protein
MLFVYREQDLMKIFTEIKDLGEIWFKLINYLKLGDDPQAELLYRQLSEIPRVRQALNLLRSE